MAVYVLNDMEITDPAMFEEYKKLSPATVAQYGGRFLARGRRTRRMRAIGRPSVW